MQSRQRRVMRQAAVAVVCALAVRFAGAQELIVGQVSSQTSPVTAMNAKGLYAGINVYFEHVNATGGINGRKLKLVNKDDQLVQGKMIEQTKEFVADKNVIALVAYQNTAGITELAKSGVVGQSGIALIAPFQGDRSIVSAEGFYPFRSGYPDEVAAMVKEAVFQQKKRVAIVYQGATFGPSMAKLAQELAKEQKLPIVAEVRIETAIAEKTDASVKDAGVELGKGNPDAIFLLMGGRAAPLTVKAIKDSAAQDAQIYGMSILPSLETFKAAGDKSRGIVITQAVPFPYSATLPLVSQYQKLMKQYAPTETISFTTLEGFIAGKITAEAIKRAGSNPTREKVIKALNSMGQYDLGGVYVDYSPKARNGWGGVDLTVIGQNGKLLR
jgi:branched-chain amino acid transport system substrate-binding protein